MAKKEISMDSFDLLTSFLEGTMHKHAEANQNEAQGPKEEAGTDKGAHKNAPSNDCLLYTSPSPRD